MPTPLVYPLASTPPEGEDLKLLGEWVALKQIQSLVPCLRHKAKAVSMRITTCVIPGSPGHHGTYVKVAYNLTLTVTKTTHDPRNV